MSNYVPSRSSPDSVLMARNKRQERALRYMERPFKDDSPMDDSAPNCSLKDFKQPRLRKCVFDIETLRIVDRINPKSTVPGWVSTEGLDGGLDGYNWKVYFGDEGPFVLKVVSLIYDSETSRRLAEYFSLTPF